MFQDGLKGYGFNFTDKKEKPLPNNAFENVQIGRNMRGFITDVNIYASFFDENDMIQWTRKCDYPAGDIFAWNTKKLDISQEEESSLNVTVVSMDKKDVCPDARKEISKQKANKSDGGQKERRRFTPSIKFQPYHIPKP